jgi:branched-chain amino acid transport system permease protein
MLLQLTFNTIVSGLLLALVAVGFNLIFNVTKVFHLAHGAVYVCGAYFLMKALNLFGEINFATWTISFCISLLLVLILSFLIEWLVYRPLSKRNASQAITLISSTGVYLLLVNFIALLFGNETKFLEPNLGSSISASGIIIIPIQLVQLGVSVILLIFLLILSKTKWFLKVRAVMSNETVASVMGVNFSFIRLFAMIIGGVLAAIAAVLRLYDTGIDPNAGMNITLAAAVAVIIGGNNSTKGTILASLLITFLQTATEWFFSAQWKESITYLLLLVVLLWRTEGIVSFKMRIEEK